jgi:hypothetical protein
MTPAHQGGASALAAIFRESSRYLVTNRRRVVERLPEQSS